MVEI
jgi:hypothetical protein